MILELPCGLLLGGVVYDHVKISELKGKQQNYLVDADLTTDNFGHVPKLIADLATDYQTKEGMPANISSEDAMWQLPTEDIEAILLKIRQETFGSNYAVPTVCLNCGKQQFKKIELDKLEIKMLPNKKIRSKSITLPKSKKQVEVKLLYLKDLFELYKSFKEKKTQLFTATTFLSIKSIDGKEPIEAKDLEEIPVTDIKIVEREYLSMRGAIDLMITHECEGCKKDYENPLGVMDPLFFVQSTTPST